MILWVWSLLGCRAVEEPTPSTDPTPVASTSAATGDTAPVAPACPSFGEAEAVGVVTDPELVELSGLVRARDVLWTHNDSGAATLVALSDGGAVVQRVALASTVIVDWEDLAVRGDSLWLADVGDNLAIRTVLFLSLIHI